jgi:hypothetical protein
MVISSQKPSWKDCRFRFETLSRYHLVSTLVYSRRLPISTELRREARVIAVFHSNETKALKLASNNRKRVEIPGDALPKSKGD